MKIYWKDQRGPSVFFSDARNQHGAKTSSISDPSVEVTVGSEGAFLHPLDYDIVGFQVTAEDLRTLLAEVALHERHNVVACYGNEKTGHAWYLVQPEGDYKAKREDGYAYFAEYPYITEYGRLMATHAAEKACKNFTKAYGTVQKRQRKEE